MFREVNPIAFAMALNAARNDMPEAQALCVSIPEADPQARYFLDPEGNAGFCLKPYSTDADYLCGVFKNPAKASCKFADMLTHADNVTDNGLQLDCFEPLAALYARHGFKTEQTVAFDPQFAPEGWDLDRHGKPAVYFMYRDKPAKAAAVAA